MGIVQRREREKQERRDAILDAAEEVFTEKGLHYTTMEDIADKSELGKSTLYLYFKTKELIYFGLDLRGSRLQKHRFEEVVRHESDGISKVLGIGRAYISHCRDYPIYFQAKTQTGRIDPAIVETYKDEPFAAEYLQTIQSLHRILVEAIISGFTDGTIRRELDPVETAYLLWAQSNGVLEVLQNRSEILEELYGIKVEDLIDTALDLMKHSLVPTSKTTT